jgi:hydrogenase-4 component E
VIVDGTFNQLCTLGSSAVLLTAFVPLWRRHIPAYISAFKWQSIALAIVTALVGFIAGVRELYVVSVLILVIRGGLMVALLKKMQRRFPNVAELDPYTNVPASLLISAVLVGIAYAVSHPVVVIATAPTRGAMPLALALVLVSMFVIASRKKAITQVIGFLMLENGVALLALVSSYGVPLTVELGVFLDALLAFLVMQIFVFDIQGTFETIDVEQLSHLKH